MDLEDDRSNASKAKASSYSPVATRSPQIFDSPPVYGSYPSAELGRSTVESKSTCARFWKAFGVTALIIVCTNMFMRTTFRTEPHHHSGTIISMPDFNRDDVVECAAFVESSFDLEFSDGLLNNLPPKYASASFKLPSDADVLFFLSRGPGMHGNVRVKPANDDSDVASVGVNINVWYWASNALERTSVCQLQKVTNEGENHGVGIFTEPGHPWRSKKDELYFEIEISLPAQAFKSLKTDYSNFGILFEELAEDVYFDDLAVKTTNGKIHAESIAAERGTLFTQNGAITGRYNTSSELALITSNAKIGVDVALNSETPSKPTKLVLRTSNGEVYGNLSLIGKDRESAFDVVSSSSNEQVMITVSEHPNSSPLKLVLASSNGKARAALHPAFEGDFLLRTSNAKSSVIEGSPDDPEGDDRRRVVDVHGIAGGFMKGQVYWGGWEDDGKGSVNVVTTNAPVELDLSGGWM